jgi:GNAT superfamily N-acetyltransferase
MSIDGLGTINYAWRGQFSDPELNALHAEGFGHELIPDDDWWGMVNRHSLGWVTARRAGEPGGKVGDLVGFVNVAWDGAVHAFILDTLVARSARREGIGTRLVEVATEHARAVGCEWLHVDFDDPLHAFYVDTCGFTPTDAGLIRLA